MAELKGFMLLMTELTNLITLEIYIDGESWEYYKKVPLEFEQRGENLAVFFGMEILKVVKDALKQNKKGQFSIKIDILGGFPQEPKWLCHALNHGIDMAIKRIVSFFPPQITRQ